MWGGVFVLNVQYTGFRRLKNKKYIHCRKTQNTLLIKQKKSLNGLEIVFD